MFSTLVQMFDDRVASAPDAACQMGKDKKGAFIPVTFSQFLQCHDIQQDLPMYP